MGLRVLLLLTLFVLFTVAQPMERIFSEPSAADGLHAAAAHQLIAPADVKLVTKGPGAATPLKAVTISSSFIDALPTSFLFTLPTGQELVVRRRPGMPTRRHVDGVNVQTWVGNVDGLAPGASAVALQVLPSGRLYGTLHFLDTSINKNRHFLVRPMADGPADGYLLAEFAEPGAGKKDFMPSARLNPIAARQRAGIIGNRRAKLNATTLAGLTGVDTTGNASETPDLPGPQDAAPVTTVAPAATEASSAVTVATVTATTIDILIVYTPAVVTIKGSVDAVLADAVGAVDKANLAYSNSLISLQLNAVAVRQVAYNSSGFDADLDNITNGYVPNVHQWREDLGADLVTLIVESTDYCGIAWLNPDPTQSWVSDYGYSIVCIDCWNGYHTMAHEMGHNMGCNHDRANSGNSPGTFSYSYGYQYTTAPTEWRTIMAYDCPGGCAKLCYFSNPNVLYNGVPMGVADTAVDSADNAATIRYTAPIVATWRATVTACPVGQKHCTGSTTCIANTSCCTDSDCTTTQTCNVANSVCACKTGYKPCSASLTGCIATTTCCNSTECSGGQACASVGATCSCPSGTKLCSGVCIPTTSCCTDADCASLATYCNTGTHQCTAGCRSGYRPCGASCILTATCCNSTECSGGQTCASAGATCACPSGTKLCNGVCIPTTACCTAADCTSTQTCNTTSHLCVCKSGYSQCSASSTGCIATGTCCNSTSCSAGQTCPSVGGACTCPSGTKLCNGACVSSSFCCSSTECSSTYTCPTPPGTAACQKKMYATVSTAIAATLASGTYTCTLTIKVTTGSGGTGTLLSGVLVTGQWTASATTPLAISASTTSTGKVTLTSMKIATTAKSCTATISAMTKSGYFMLTTLPAQTKTWT